MSRAPYYSAMPGIGDLYSPPEPDYAAEAVEERFMDDTERLSEIIGDELDNESAWLCDALALALQGRLFPETRDNNWADLRRECERRFGAVFEKAIEQELAA